MKLVVLAILALTFTSAAASAAPSSRAPEPPTSRAPESGPQDHPDGVRTVQELVLADGSRVFGVVEAQSDAEVVFRTTSGALLTTPRARVRSIRKVVGRMVRGEFRRQDPNNTRLLFGPTGRSIPKGEVYLGVYEILVPFVQVGVTNQISIGGGTPLIFEMDDWDRLYWVTPKVQVFSGSGVHAAVGVFHGFAGNDGAGIAYGVVTKEAGPGAVTVGGGMAYSSEGDRGGVFMIGAEAPVRRNIKWITENYVWSSTVITAGGFRFFGEHLSADLAVGIAFNDGDAFAFPVVNFVYRF